MKTPILPILIGSGVSCAGRLPGVTTLSNRIAERISRTKANTIFQKIKTLCDADREKGESNYEDWLYVTIQIRDHISREYENTALCTLVLSLLESSSLNEDALKRICEEIIVESMNLLCSDLTSTIEQANRAFPKLKMALQTYPDTRLRFFTLNHDCMLEKYLKHLNVEYYDGFSPIDGLTTGQRLDFDSRKFREAAISLIKLHGSINWWRYRPARDPRPSNPWLYEFIGIEMGENRKFHSLGETPLILAGTFNKILQYTSPVFLQFVAEFYQTLQNTNVLAVTGYGFADKGLNSLIANWMTSSSERHRFVIDPYPLDEQRARGAILGKTSLWEEESRLHVTRAAIGENFDWQQLLTTTLK